MGNIICADCTMDEDERHEFRENKRIHKSLMRELKNMHTGPQRLVLLGPGSSGKSTIFKQTKIVYKGGFTHEELTLFRAPIFATIINSVHAICAYIKQTHSSLWTDELKKLATPILGLDPFTELSKAQGERVQQLWQHETIQLGYKERSQFQLDDNTDYFMSHIPRITAKGFVPNQEDVVRVRVRTSGITESNVTIEGVPFVIIDAGGQRGERRKWIHLFDKIRAVLFVAALNEYDLVLAEDSRENRMTEALNLFGDICARLPNTTIVLFLNKEDLLLEKLKAKESPLSALFPEFDGGWDSRSVIRFLQKKFIEKDKSEDRDMYIHVTSAVDTQIMERVFHSVKDFILRKNLQLAHLV